MALPLISNISTENIVPLYMFSVLTFVITLASPRHPSNLLIIDNGVVPQWLCLFQGIRSMMDAEKDTLYSSPLAAIYHVTPKMCDFSESKLPSASEGFRELEQNISMRDEKNPCKDAILAREI
ncbi:hypothetical protein N7453_011994 [Penicillium expansum]|nr:hypothetical protein N7453_011994 [Penicillium expansum]